MSARVDNSVVSSRKILFVHFHTRGVARSATSQEKAGCSALCRITLLSDIKTAVTSLCGAFGGQHRGSYVSHNTCARGGGGLRGFSKIFRVGVCRVAPNYHNFFGKRPFTYG